MPGLSTERMGPFPAACGEADRAGPGGGLAAEGTSVSVHEMPLPERAAMGRRAAITDLTTSVLPFAPHVRRPGLLPAPR